MLFPSIETDTAMNARESENYLPISSSLLLSIFARRHFIDDYVPCMRGVKKNYDNVQIQVITIYSGAVWLKLRTVD